MFLVYMYFYCLYSHTINIFFLEHTRIIQLSVIAAVSKTQKAKAVDPGSGKWFLLSHTLYMLLWHICRIKHIIFMHCKKLNHRFICQSI